MPHTTRKLPVKQKKTTTTAKVSGTKLSPIESQQFMQKIPALVPGLVAVYNLNTGQYLYINDSITKILGYSKNEWLTKGLAFATTLVHPDDIAVIMAQNNKALKKANSTAYRDRGNDPIVAFEYRLKHKNGSWRWLKTDGVIFSRDTAGKVECVMNISVDITARKETELKETLTREAAEEALRASEAQLRATWEAAADGMALSDENGVVLSANKAYYDLYGFKPEEIIGKNFAIIFPKAVREAVNKEYTKIFFGTKASEVVESKITRKDGSERYVASRYSFPQLNKGVRAMLSIVRDITEQKRIEQDKNDFISIATHELKTPVTSIKAYAEVLERKFNRAGDSASAIHLGKMNAQLDKLTSLISDLLDVTKIESGQLQMQQETFVFDDLIAEIVEELQRTTEKHVLSITGSSGKTITADRERIGQVLTNLISNAIKYSPHTERIIITPSAAQGYVTVCVQDFGVGIPKAKQGKLFERFYRVSGPADNTFPGLGLGLYISSEIIKRQGGSMWVESTPGKGSAFYFTVPIKGSVKKRRKNGLAQETIKHE
jgi:PAS domain S-box-containing protein